MSVQIPDTVYNCITITTRFHLSEDVFEIRQGM